MNDHPTIYRPIHFKTLLRIVFLCAWLALVIVLTCRHEMWRDEVRDYSLVASLTSPARIFEVTQNEGHPFLWYFLLWIGARLFNTPHILPVFNITLTFLAMAMLTFRSPFKWWVNTLIGFSPLVFYEFAVISRPYGISLLFIVCIAIVYKDRRKRSWLLGGLLALLANTNVHAAIAAGLIAMMWFMDLLKNRKRASLTQKERMASIAGLMIAAIGLALCVFWIIPRPGSIFYAIRGNLVPANVIYAAVNSLAHPEVLFSHLIPASVPAGLVLLLYYLVLFGLVTHPALLGTALIAQIAFGVLFQIVYAGSARHEGIFVIFLLFLFWRKMESPLTIEAVKARWQMVAHYASILALCVFFAANFVQQGSTVLQDLRGQYSSSKAFGEFLNHSSVYQNAIIVPEPDYLIESVHYYADNPIYLAREDRFSPTVSWTLDAQTHLSLGELLDKAQSIKHTSAQPVLLALGFRHLGTGSSGSFEFSYNKSFSWTAADLKRFDQETSLVASFTDSSSDENYLVFELK